MTTALAPMVLQADHYMEETFELIADFKNHIVKDRNLSKATAYNYGLDLGKFFDWFDHPYTEVTRKICVDYIRHLADKKMHEKTRNRNLSSIKEFFHYIVGEVQKLAANPASDIKSARVEIRNPKPVDTFDIDIIFNVVDNLRDLVIFELIYGLGCRRSELINISKADINYRGKSIRLIGKGNKERIVPIHSEALALVKKLADSHDSTWLFPSRQYRTNHLSTRIINKIVLGWVTKAGLANKGITPHKFRHSFGTHMFEGGADIKALADMMGHASMNTTQIYAKVSNERNQREYESSHPRAKKQP